MHQLFYQNVRKFFSGPLTLLPFDCDAIWSIGVYDIEYTLYNKKVKSLKVWIE